MEKEKTETTEQPTAEELHAQVTEQMVNAMKELGLTPVMLVGLKKDSPTEMTFLFTLAPDKPPTQDVQDLDDVTLMTLSSVIREVDNGVLDVMRYRQLKLNEIMKLTAQTVSLALRDKPEEDDPVEAVASYDSLEDVPVTEDSDPE